MNGMNCRLCSNPRNLYEESPLVGKSSSAAPVLEVLRDGKEPFYGSRSTTLAKVAHSQELGDCPCCTEVLTANHSPNIFYFGFIQTSLLTSA